MFALFQTRLRFWSRTLLKSDLVTLLVHQISCHHSSKPGLDNIPLCLWVYKPCSCIANQNPPLLSSRNTSDSFVSSSSHSRDLEFALSRSQSRSRSLLDSRSRDLRISE